MSRLDQASRLVGGAPSLGLLGLLAVIWLSWGIAYPVMGLTMAVVDPLTLRCTVMLVAGVAVLAYAGLAGRAIILPRALWRDCALSAFGTMTICQMGLTYGVYYVGAGRSSVLIYTMPIWAALFARLLLGEPITPRRGVALALGAAAVAALLAQHIPEVRNAPLGLLANIVAAFGFALGTVWTKRTVWPIDSIVIAGWQLTIGALPLIAVWLVIQPPVEPARFGPMIWLAFAYMTVVANAIAYVVWFRLVRRLPAAVASLGSLAVPCFGVLASALLADEMIQPNDLIALALVCCALALVLFEPRRIA